MITVVRSTAPPQVCKRYTLGKDGALIKTAVANISEGVAECHDVADADAMAALLQQITTRDNEVIVPGVFHGCDGQPFQIVPEVKLATLLKLDIDKDVVPGGLQTINGKPYAARVKRGITPSEWMLFDFDNPPGMPPDWMGLTIHERMYMMEPILPGLSTCERIELRGSSARVHSVDEAPGLATHAWVRVDAPAAIERMRAFVQIAMVNRRLSFPSPRYSKADRTVVIGHDHRTVADISVWITGRLVFCAQPQVEPAGYQVADADVRIVNRGGGPLRIGHIQLPDAEALRAYRARTGHHVKLGTGAVGMTVHGQLTRDTEIEVRGAVKPLGAWLDGMQVDQRLRCEAPFRASTSEAAFIKKHGDGSAIVHDIGTSTSFVLDAPAPPDESGDLVVHDVGEIDLENIQPRQWLLGNVFCIPFISQAVAMGGAGKTALRMVQALALATARSLTNEHVFRRSRVLYISLEDGFDEARRRLKAAMKHHKITQQEVKGWLYLSTPKRLRLAEPSTTGGPPRPGPLHAALIAVLERLRPDLIILDPFIKSHGLEENDNNGLDYVATLLAELADKYNVAIDAPHHERKGASREPGDADRGRGASAFKDAGRLVYSLTTMTDEEEKKFGVKPEERRLFFRVDNAKVNLVPPLDQGGVVQAGRREARQRDGGLSQRR